MSKVTVSHESQQPMPADVQSKSTGAAFGAWAFWMAAMLATLAAFAARLPLAAKMPSPAEDGALAGVGFMAMLVAAALAPALLSSWQNALIAIVSLLPMLTFAALLSGGLAGDVVPSFAIGGTWMLAMASVMRLRAPVLRALGSAALMLLSIGAPAVWYVGQEFGDRPATALTWLEMVSPTQGILSTSAHSGAVYWNLILPTAVFFVERAISFGRVRRNSNTAIRPA